MEDRLRKLFDYQKFAGNAKLQAVIDSVHAQEKSRDLSLDDLEMVAAAGNPFDKLNDEKKDNIR